MEIADRRVAPGTISRLMNKENPGRRIKLYLLLTLGAVHLLVTFSAIVPGYLSIDEIVYHWMTINLASSRGFEIQNGYGELPSPELSPRMTRTYAGRLVSQYPYLFPILALPLYYIFGFYGLFLTNALAFVGTVILCFAIAHKLFDDIDLALNSCLILILGTFAWEYSQAAWPHSTALFFAMTAFYLFVCGFSAEPGPKSVLFSAAAGAVVSFGASVRIDALLVLPALLLPWLFVRPARIREASAALIGTVPGLILLSVFNAAKFNSFNPFSYGEGTGIKTDHFLLVAALVTLLWAVYRYGARIWQSAWKVKAPVVITIILGAFIIVLMYQELVLRLLSNALVTVVDIRYLDPAVRLDAARRSPGGGLMYIGAYKKALLQSLPFLVILALPLRRIFQGHRDGGRLLLLFLVPVTFVGYYSYRVHEYGGLSLNYRYYLMLLPLAAILSAYALRDIQSNWEVRFNILFLGSAVGLTTAAYFFLSAAFGDNPKDQEFAVLDVPLVISAILLLLLCAAYFSKNKTKRVFRVSAYFFLIAAMTWSSLSAFTYDYPRHRWQRITNYVVGGWVLDLIPTNSILFTAPYIDPVMRIIERDGVIVAFPARDNFKHFPVLLEHHLKAGRRAFAAFPTDLWEHLKSGVLSQHKVTPILEFPGGFIGEILPSAHLEAP